MEPSEEYDMYKKLGLMLLYAGIAYFIYVYGKDILAWVGESNHVPLVTFIAVCMALFPVIPYPLVGGVIGAAYGPVFGGIITWIGSAVASILMFLFVRYGYQEWGNSFKPSFICSVHACLFTWQNTGHATVRHRRE
ncbi:hypothetical protein [Paenibacillus uliginis]|uniref:hypothetical protein n=1 Tax=Paenibacillus uliginis TaxID=683737 RepID=UPI00313DF5CD